MTPPGGRDARVERGAGLAALAALVVVATAAQLLLMQRDGEAMQSARLGPARQVLSARTRATVSSAPAPRPWQLASSTTGTDHARQARAVGVSESAESRTTPARPPARSGDGVVAAFDDVDGAAAGTEPVSPSRMGPAPSAEEARGGSAERPAVRPGFQVAGAYLPEPAVETPIPAAHDGEQGGPGSSAPDDPGPAAGEEPSSGLDHDAGGVQLMVLGPVTARKGDTISFPIMLDGAQGVAHAPVRVQYDPAVLEFVGAQEGPFLSMDGAGTEFIAQPSSTPGEVQIALSRMPPARGISGSGTLCTLTFVAREAGDTPIVTSGSRLLDSTGRIVEFRRNDSHVAIQ